MSMPTSRRAALLAAAVTLSARPGAAQVAWPSRPVRLVVPVAPGGSVDILARTIAPALQDRVGQPVTVENRTGASGSVGGVAVAQAAPDGHTLLISASMQPLARYVMRNPPYDPLVDLKPLGRLGTAPLLMAISPARPQRTLGEVVEAARARPRDWSFGVGSLGSAGHLATIELARLIGGDIALVTYRGTTPALQDLLGGQIGLHMDPVLAMLPQVRAGTLRGIAVTAPRRLAAAPEMQTTAEAGFPSVDVHSWWGLWGPQGLSDALGERVQAVVGAVMDEPAVRARLVGVGVDPMFEGATDFAAFQARDVARAEQLLRLGRFELE